MRIKNKKLKDFSTEVWIALMAVFIAYIGYAFWRSTPSVIGTPRFYDPPRLVDPDYWIMQYEKYDIEWLPVLPETMLSEDAIDRSYGRLESIHRYLGALLVLTAILFIFIWFMLFHFKKKSL